MKAKSMGRSQVEEVIDRNFLQLKKYLKSETEESYQVSNRISINPHG